MSNRSICLRALATVLIAMVVGPFVGGATVLYLFARTTPAVKGTRIASILNFGPEFKEYLEMSYFFGVIPALCGGLLFSISVFWLRKNSISAAFVSSLLASVILIVFFEVLNPASFDLRGFALLAVLPSIAAGIVCWFVSKPLHRLP